MPTAVSCADPQRHLGSCISDALLSFRLRYAFSRKFAPYFGYSWDRKFGMTANMPAVRAGADRQILLGVRAWFWTWFE